VAESKREKLRENLLNAAEKRIIDQGIGALRARDITQDAGCALGSLYTAYKDLDLLILAANSRTLSRLHDELRAAVAAETDPHKQLLGLAAAYVSFALNNRHAWSALFDHRMPEGAEVPDWHIQEHAALVGEIIAPLSALLQTEPEQLALQARTLFSAVHGIVKLSLEDRFVALGPDTVSAALDDFLGAQLRGLAGR